MSRKYCLLLYLLIAWVGSVTAARSLSDTLFPWGNYQLKTHLTGEFSQFEPDLFGNILAIRKTGQLIKYAPNGDSLAAFNDLKQIGRAHV